MTEKMKFAKKKDILVVLGLLLLALIIWGIFQLLNQGRSGPYANVYYMGEIVEVLYLDEPKTYSVPQLPQVELEVQDNAIAFVHSNCPDQVCVHTGWLTGRGHFAACLPNQIMVMVENDEADSGPDITAK